MAVIPTGIPMLCPSTDDGIDNVLEQKILELAGNIEYEE